MVRKYSAGMVALFASSLFASAAWADTISISTTDGGSFVLGSSSRLTDSATLTGGLSPSGAITFFLFAPGITPNGTNSNNIYSDTVTIIGDATYSTASGNNPGGYLPSATGIYQWLAVYSGDPNNPRTTSTFGSEPEDVSVASSVPEPGTLALLGAAFSGLGLIRRRRRRR